MRKVILISGGSDGVGKETARLLSADHTVVILARTRETLEAAAKELQCDHAVADVTDYGQLAKAVEEIMKKHGRIDCLVNNAGLWIEGALDENGPAKIKEVMDVNALGTIYLSKTVLPAMKAQKSGLIVNVISQSGLYGKKERSVYHASKWAITGFTKSLEAEVSPYGIRVSGVYPGKICTALFEKAGVDKPMDNALNVTAVAKAIRFVVETDEDTVIPEMGIKLIGG